MNLVKTILVILNTLCGFIQIGITFFLQPFGYWLFPIPIIIGFVWGYMNKTEAFFKGERKEIMNTGILFLVNLAFLVLVGVVCNDPTSDTFSIMLLLTTMMFATIPDFEGFGRALGRYKNVS